MNYKKIELELKDIYNKYSENEIKCLEKILDAFHNVKLADTDFYWPTGYGYSDVGREKIEKIYSYIFKTEDALVRPNLVSGTHALFITLNTFLNKGDHLLSVNGDPYDTLQKCIGISGNESGNLKSKGVSYDKVNLIDDMNFDIENIISSVKSNTKMIMVQRSRGYSFRKAMSIKKIGDMITKVKKVYPNIIVMVDNCYGEFVESMEPSEVGADLTVGSLIKNPGGGIALTGGYVVGKTKYIEAIANQLTAPGIGKECGLTFGTSRLTLQGLFNAPHIVCESLKTATLFSYVFKEKGYTVSPTPFEERTDIVQILQMNSKEELLKFCNTIQSASPVDAHVRLEPWKMPGYDNDIVMASGSFVQGSSIEISADAPVIEPFYVYMQGGMSYAHGKIVLNKILNNL